MRRLASKSDMPSSCRYSVKNTSAFHGMFPTMPYAAWGFRDDCSIGWGAETSMRSEWTATKVVTNEALHWYSAQRFKALSLELK